MSNYWNECGCPDLHYDDGKKCVPHQTCPEGTFLKESDGQCHKCAEGCAECSTNTGYCIKCKGDGYTKWGQQCYCPNYMFDSGTHCAKKVTCTIGQYKVDSLNMCLPCGENCFDCADNTGECNECISSTEHNYIMDDKKHSCHPQDCGAGRYYSVHNQDCKECASGCGKC